MSTIIEEIPIRIKQQHVLLNRLAEGYKTLSKALMEYIDNSFDSADNFFDENNNLFSKDIKIDILIDRNKQMISIKDNCTGMNENTIKGLANSINDSEKRVSQKRAWVAGKFGLGAHAYRFFAQKLTVTSKILNGPRIAIEIDRDDDYASLILPKIVQFEQSGTLVELQDIDKDHLKKLCVEELKNDIEVYFEMLLKRNVEITIFDGDLQLLCKPFDYNLLNGVEIKKKISTWKEDTTIVSVPEVKGIDVNLKVCSQKIEPPRPPFFSRKGRRINYISNMDSFMRQTQHRKKVWESYYLTGYIEVQDNLEPKISRDDFVGGKGKLKKRDGIYKEIINLEDEIYEAIEKINKDRSDESLRNLANRLTDILSQLVKEQELNLKYQNGNDGNKNKAKQKIVPNDDSLDEFEVRKRGPGGNGPNKGDQTEVIKAILDENGEILGEKVDRQKSGIRVEFNTLPSDERSHYGDGVITIFTSHKDFQDRKTYTSKAELGQMKITARLANYLSAVISSEYKEVFYQKKKLEPPRKTVLNEQIDFIFQFEEKMKDIVDQPLDAIGIMGN